MSFNGYVIPRFRSNFMTQRRKEVLLVSSVDISYPVVFSEINSTNHAWKVKNVFLCDFVNKSFTNHRSRYFEVMYVFVLSKEVRKSASENI